MELILAVIMTLLLMSSWIMLIRMSVKVKYLSMDMQASESRFLRLEQRIDHLYSLYIKLEKEKD